ncbi:gamma-aminobutyric acid receptor subunit beta-like [Homarus americanus]|uniref:gamma-aminobutyric acid receptor subunit beta-like n=1 Tax=Homarus americanus TaxID=6706 RepID=UPI001C4773FE|nr:gamma-aminobutyric acid receptor subunit beta-like [Homarus americanus]
MYINTLATNAYPTGKHEWITDREMCGVAKGNIITLSLSPCTSEDFMCSSGQCTDQHFRCNLDHDCIDGSDEVNCGKVEVGNEYQSELPPAGPKGSVLKLLPELILLRVVSIDDISMAIDVELQVVLTWIDDRLSLRHLSVSRGGAILTKDEMQMVWTPKYQLMNLESGKMELLEQSISITTANNATVSAFNNVNRDLLYPGATNNLSIISHYTARFTCFFRFFGYPFDVQYCTIDVRLPSTYEEIVEFSEEVIIHYTGDTDLALYTIRDIMLGSDSGTNKAILEFKLHRRPGVVMLSTFLPSSLLLLVSWSTLFIKLEALNVRAIMSLTTLLVLYTLFSNLSSSLPTTAEIKLIDIWFFFIISLLFVNIMVNVFVRNEVTPRPSPSVKRVTQVRPMLQEDLPPIELKIYVSVRFLYIYKMIVIPILIIIFNIFFWLAVFILK